MSLFKRIDLTVNIRYTVSAAINECYIHSQIKAGIHNQL